MMTSLTPNTKTYTHFCGNPYILISYTLRNWVAVPLPIADHHTAPGQWRTYTHGPRAPKARAVPKRLRPVPCASSQKNIGLTYAISRGPSSGTLFYLRIFSCGIATTGIHAFFARKLASTGTLPEGTINSHANLRDILRGNRPPREIFPREVATTITGDHS